MASKHPTVAELETKLEEIKRAITDAREAERVEKLNELTKLMAVTGALDQTLEYARQRFARHPRKAAKATAQREQSDA